MIDRDTRYRVGPNGYSLRTAPRTAGRGHEEGPYSRGEHISPKGRGQLVNNSQATLHGNRPAKGAMMDKELMTEDAETVRRMEERKERKKGLGHSSGSSSME